MWGWWQPYRNILGGGRERTQLKEYHQKLQEPLAAFLKRLRMSFARSLGPNIEQWHLNMRTSIFNKFLTGMLPGDQVLNIVPKSAQDLVETGWSDLMKITYAHNQAIGPRGERTTLQLQYLHHPGSINGAHAGQPRSGVAGNPALNPTQPQQGPATASIPTAPPKHNPNVPGHGQPADGSPQPDQPGKVRSQSKH